jgi:hypothetical protein
VIENFTKYSFLSLLLAVGLIMTNLLGCATLDKIVANISKSHHTKSLEKGTAYKKYEHRNKKELSKSISSEVSFHSKKDLPHTFEESASNVKSKNKEVTQVFSSSKGQEINDDMLRRLQKSSIIDDSNIHSSSEILIAQFRATSLYSRGEPDEVGTDGKINLTMIETIRNDEAFKEDNVISSREQFSQWPPSKIASVGADIGSPYAGIDSSSTELMKNGKGFRLKFKVINLSGTKPISGTVVIVAKRKAPYEPRFISIPQMELNGEGIPLRLKKSLKFYRVRKFKYFTGEFDFPLSFVQSFRILIYNRKDRLVCDQYLPQQDGKVLLEKAFSDRVVSAQDASNFAEIESSSNDLLKNGQTEETDVVGTINNINLAIPVTITNEEIVTEDKILVSTEKSIEKNEPKSVSLKIDYRSTYARIENPSTELINKGMGFRLKFKVVNPNKNKPIAGTVAIVANRKVPYKPRYISVPNMELNDRGFPLKLKKSLKFQRIRRFKDFTGEFDFPLSFVQSFRILIYNRKDSLACDQVIIHRDGEVFLKSDSSNLILLAQDNSTFTQIKSPMIDLLRNGEGFCLKFKVLNSNEKKATSGTVAIITKLKAQYVPRFISFPKMELNDEGVPVKLNKLLQFYRLRRYKYFTGEFDFPLSYVQSFRILIYNRRDQLVHKHVLLSEMMEPRI